MNNVIPIRPGIQIPNAFTVRHPIAPIRPAAQAAPTEQPMSLGKIAAIAVVSVVLFEGAAYLWNQSKPAKYRAY